jgi:hypothetical protein
VNYTRRAFLQQAAIGLASIGISQASMAAAAHRFSQALATKPVGRKFAFLVGIDRYPKTAFGASSLPGSPPLSGCETDVRLQKELLIHRFGFKPDDICVLVNEDATRQAIEETFRTHLVEQAQPGDLVVFHFSGLGSQVNVLDDEQQSYQVKNSLVPVDGALPSDEQPFLNDMMMETLTVLARSLQTEHIITVLDTSFKASDDTRSNFFRQRVRPGVPKGKIRDDELALQDQLRQQIRANKGNIANLPYPGMLLKATDSSHSAVECQWEGFSAGLFTYLLTQQLWEQGAETSIATKVSLAGAKAEQIVGAPYPVAFTGTKTDKLSLKKSRFHPIQSLTADGAVIGKKPDGAVQVFLGGLPPIVLSYYKATAIFRCAADGDRPLTATVTSPTIEPPPSSPTTASVLPVTPTSEPEATAENPDTTVSGQAASTTAPSDSPQPCYVQLRSREGLYGQVRRLQSAQASLKVGQILFEHIRVFSKAVSLKVALDTQLERIERVDATSALSNIEGIASVVAGEQAADVLFGKSLPFISKLDNQESADDADSTDEGDRPAVSEGYGLFYLSHAPIPNTLDRSEEAVKTAVQRLEPKFRNLLATKLLRLTENQGSSLLGVQATLEMLAPQERILMQQTTFRSPWVPPDSRLAQLLVTDGSVPSLPIGSKIRYRIQNYSDLPIYCVMVGVDGSGSLFAVHPSEALGANNAKDASINKESMIPPGEMLTLPPNNTSVEWTISGSTGLTETYVICSRTPLERMTQELMKAMRPMGNFRQMSMLSDATDPTTVMQAMLGDLDKASRPKNPEKFGIASDAYALHMEKYASMNFIYRVV